MFRRSCLLLFSIAIGLVSLDVRPSAEGPAATFHAVGDLTGGGFTTVIRDATKLNGVISAVGGAVTRLSVVDPGTGALWCSPAGLCPFTDTAILWQFDGTNGSLQALPDYAANSSTASETAFSITPDAAYIASQARIQLPQSFPTRATRVTTSLLPDVSANQNLAAAPFSAATPPGSALAISLNGSILYGSRSVTIGGVVGSRAVRFSTVAGTSVDVPSPAGVSGFNPVALKGTSNDGSVAVGSIFTTASDHRAYRYSSSSGTSTLIPLLPGGTYNDALAVGPGGDNVLVTGNSTEYPNGEVYLYSVGAGGIAQRLGSPNSLWGPGGQMCISNGCQPATILLAGMAVLSSTTRVVAMNFSGADGQEAYINNPHGWFQLTSVLAANGIDLAAAGWSRLVITGISRDATLVYGFGAHDDSIDGFVVEFGAGVLDSFNPTPVPPLDTSIVGAWTCSDPSGSISCVVVFTDDGAYYQIEGDPAEEMSGFERGDYAFDGSQLTVLTRLDTNGRVGLSGSNGPGIPITISGDILMLGAEPVGLRIPGSAGTLAGAWVQGAPTQPDSSLAIVFLPTGKYLMAWDDADAGINVDGIEVGQFAWNPVTGSLVPDISHGVHISTSGGDGLSDFAAEGPLTLALTPNGLSLDTGGPNSPPLRRVIDPATIPVIAGTPLSATSTVGAAFSFHVTATNTVAFSATGLPNGLSIDSVTGEISGTPNVGGQFAVTIKATNTVGVSDIETVTLTIAIPTPVGVNVIVRPEVPEGQGPVTLSFGQITSAGETTVTVIDLDEAGVPPPGNVAVAGVVYDVTTTASFSGLITLCFSYAGIDFGTAEPRLFHFENGVWVDITTSVSPQTQTICGATTSLSPFAILVSPVVRKGFYAPVSPIAGFLNTVKGGSTTPLKFEVFVNGVEQTTTNGLSMTQQQIECDASAPLGEVEATPDTGGTSLRYAGGNFMQNWKVPNTPGRCYMVRVTTSQDGLALTARFKVK